MSSLDGHKLFALIPGAYFVQTRIEGPRALLYTIGTSFIPAWWLLVRLAGEPPMSAIGTFALGYLAFISLYELGYLANDLLDARRPGERQRCAFTAGPVYVLLFTVLRLGCWAGIGFATSWIADALWLSGHLAMVVVFALHNLIESPAPRSATFVQLALLRFILPILGALPAMALPLALLLALLLYVYLRWLAYLDSKSLLAMPARKDGNFGLIQIGLLLPILFVVAIGTSSTLPLELWLWFVFLYFGWLVAGRRKALA